MMEIEINKSDHILYLMPKGELNKNDLKSLSDAIDNYINEGNLIKGLLVDTESVPHWKDLSAFKAHLEVIREKGKILNKVAVVSDNNNVMMLSQLIKLFIDSEVKHFDHINKSEAIDWLK